MRNKANSPKRGTEAVSRLRILDCGLATDLRRADRLCETNPISERWTRPGAGCAKQTQFPAGTKSHHSIIPPFQYSSPLPGVRNKANSSIADWGQVRGGTPALRPAASGLQPFPGPIVRNKANSHGAKTGTKPWAGKELCRICPLHRSRKTKPISAPVPIGRSAFPGVRNKPNSSGSVAGDLQQLYKQSQLDGVAHRAKQSQFSTVPGRDAAWEASDVELPPRPPLLRPRANSAKQTQFA